MAASRNSRAGLTPQRRTLARVLLCGALVSILVNALGTSSASAAGRITKPTNPFVYSLKSDGTPYPFDVESTGWQYHQLVWVEICDGLPATAAGWSASLDCDDETSPSAVAATKAGTVTFPAASSNYGLVPFHGASPSGTFNCVGKNEIPSDAKEVTGTDASGRQFTYYNLSAKDTQAPDGTPLAPGTRAWTACQIRVASNYTVATNDQQFITVLIPAGSDPHTGSSNTALYVAIGLAVLLIIAGGGAYLLRRRPTLRAAPIPASRPATRSRARR